MIPKVVSYEALLEKDPHVLYHSSDWPLEDYISNMNNKNITDSKFPRDEWAIIGGTESIMKVCNVYDFEFRFTGRKSEFWGGEGLRMDIFCYKAHQKILSSIRLNLRAPLDIAKGVIAVKDDTLTIVAIHNHREGHSRITSTEISKGIQIFLSNGRNPVNYPRTHEQIYQYG